MPEARPHPVSDSGGVDLIPRREPVVLPRQVYRPFPVEVLPEPVRGFVVMSSESCHCDHAFVALPLLAALASAIGNSRRVEIKPDWLEPSTLWTATIGMSGSGKSPSLARATRFASQQDLKAQREAEDKKERYEEEKQRYDRAYSKWRRSRKADDPPPAKPNPPPEARHVINETTVEAMASLLAESPRGLLLVRDELSGWFGGFGQYKSGASQADEAQWLEMYGAGALRVDRKGKGGSVYVPRANVSIAGGIQPLILAKCLTNERIASGLAARFLFAMPPDEPRLWSKTSVSPALQEEVRGVFDTLYLLTGTPETEEQGLTPLDIPLTPEAQALFVDLHDRMRREQIDLEPALRAAWSKLIGTCPRLALILHCVQDAIAPSWPLERPIEASTMEAALTLVDWCAEETRRVYAGLRESADDRLRSDLLDAATRREGRLTVREAMQLRPQQLPNADAAREALQALEAAELGRLERTPSGPRGGRPSDVFVVAQQNDKTDETPSGEGSVGFVDGDAAAGEQVEP